MFTIREILDRPDTASSNKVIPYFQILHYFDNEMIVIGNV